MSVVPAHIARLSDQGRPLLVTEPANVTLVDPTARAVVDRDASASLSRNNPWHGRELPDPVVATVWAGRVTWSRPGVSARATGVLTRAFRRVIATPTSDRTPPRIASSTGTSPRNSQPSRIETGGTANVLMPSRPAELRLSANAQVEKARAVGTMPR